MSVHRLRDVFAGLVIALSMAALASAAPVQMNLVTKITLPGKGGHGDWVAFDPGANKVYVALHGSGVAVVDVATNKVTA
jgi:DNA-binding beta-propeller fold protein YncE